MAKDIQAGVRLKLNDDFSVGIGKAAGASSGFAESTLGALDKVNSALSGTAATIDAFGVSLSVGAATKEIIELDLRLTRIGLTYRATADEVGQLKQNIYDASLKYKIATDLNVEAADALLTATGDIQFLEANIDNMARAIQGAGMEGAEAASIFAQFNQFGYDAAEIENLLDTFSAFGDTGKYTFQAFSSTGVKVMSTYGASVGKTTDDMKDRYKTMLMIMAGVGSEDESATALEDIGAGLSNTKKQEALRKKGIEVVNKETGKLRSYLEIAEEIKAVTEKKGNQFWLSEIFGETGLRGIRAIMEYADMFDERIEAVGDSTGSLQNKADTMAGTLQSNLQSLQTAFVRFADSNLTEPLAKLTEWLNKLNEDPKKVEAVFRAVARGVAIVGAVKIGAGICFGAARYERRGCGESRRDVQSFGRRGKRSDAGFCN